MLHLLGQYLRCWREYPRFHILCYKIQQKNQYWRCERHLASCTQRSVQEPSVWLPLLNPTTRFCKQEWSWHLPRQVALRSHIQFLCWLQWQLRSLTFWLCLLNLTKKRFLHSFSCFWMFFLHVRKLRIDKSFQFLLVFFELQNCISFSSDRRYYKLPYLVWSIKKEKCKSLSYCL